MTATVSEEDRARAIEILFGDRTDKIKRTDDGNGFSLGEKDGYAVSVPRLARAIAAIRSEARVAGSAEGWRLVPVEPTEAMLTAANDVEHECLQWSLEPGEGLDGVDFEPAYKAMLAAAPRPAPDETGER